MRTSNPRCDVVSKEQGSLHLHHRSAIAIAACTLVWGAANSVTAQQMLVPTGSDWKFLDDGSDQGVAWADPAFDDTTWASGPAQLGYGDGDEATVVSYGPDPNNKYITTYFRHTFEVTDLTGAEILLLNVLRDDGAVVYLNGSEVFRTNMPGGSINYLTHAAVTIGGAEENTFYPQYVDLSGVHLGTNVLAVEIHQANGTSSDVSFDLSLEATTLTPRLIRGPYLQRTSWSETVIRWRTDFACDSVVMYGDAPNNLTEMRSDGTLKTEHEITVSDLLLETVYYYSIGSSTEVFAGGDEFHYVKTAPAPGSDVPVRLWVLGDSGTGDVNAAAVRDAYYAFAGGQHTDAVLMLGDNAYNSGKDEEYQTGLFDMYPELLRQTTFWPAYGNHDAMSADANTETGPYFENFTLPRAGEAGGLPSGTEAYYSFDYGPVHFVCLDSAESSRLPGSAMMNWFEADLDQTDAPWVIAYWHHPPYTHGSHSSDNPFDSGQRMFDMREVAGPILEAANVDLVLGGHSHSYERSYLMAGHYGTSDTLLPEMILDAGDGRLNGNGAYMKPTRKTPQTGTVYNVAGSSGWIGGGTLDHPAMFFSANQLGSVVIDVNGNDLTAQFLDPTGVVQDWYTISKTDALNNCITLNVKDLFAGMTATFKVTGGTPGSQAVVLWGIADGSFQQNNNGWCVDFGFQVPIQDPLSRLVGFGVFDANGTFTIRKPIPFKYFGLDVRFQAAMKGTCPDPCMSNVLSLTVR